MFGKLFASAYTGSLVGKGPSVFAVLGYVIAYTRDSHVELNPTVVAASIGTTEQDIKDAIAILCAPDKKSRNPAEKGRRLVYKGGFRYFVVSYEKYRNMRSEDDRAAYMREYMKKYRKNGVRKQVNTTVKLTKPQLAQAEAEAEAETEEVSSSLKGSTLNGTRAEPLALSGDPEPKGKKGSKFLVRLAEVTADASAAYNETLAKPKGVLPAVRLTIGRERRQAHVKRSLREALDICREVFDSPTITREFWDAYFGSCAKDDFLSGRRRGGKGHENWSPDFEYLTRRDVMLRVFEREVGE